MAFNMHDLDDLGLMDHPQVNDRTCEGSGKSETVCGDGYVYRTPRVLDGNLVHPGLVSSPRAEVGGEDRCGASIQTTSGARGICVAHPHVGARQCGRCSPHCECAAPRRPAYHPEKPEPVDASTRGLPVSYRGIPFPTEPSIWHEGRRQAPPIRRGGSPSDSTSGENSTPREIGGGLACNYYATSGSIGKHPGLLRAKASMPELMTHTCRAECAAYCQLDFSSWCTDDLAFCGLYSDPAPSLVSVAIAEGGGVVMEAFGERVQVRRVSDLYVVPWSRARDTWRWWASRCRDIVEQFLDLVREGLVRMTGVSEASRPGEPSGRTDTGSQARPAEVVFDSHIPYYGLGPAPAGMSVLDMSRVNWWVDGCSHLSRDCQVNDRVQLHLVPSGLVTPAMPMRRMPSSRLAYYRSPDTCAPPEDCVCIGKAYGTSVLVRAADLDLTRTVVVRAQDVAEDAYHMRGSRCVVLGDVGRAHLFGEGSIGCYLDARRERRAAGGHGVNCRNKKGGMRTGSTCRVPTKATVYEILDWVLPDTPGPSYARIEELLRSAGLHVEFPEVRGGPRVVRCGERRSGMVREHRHTGGSDSDCSSIPSSDLPDFYVGGTERASLANVGVMIQGVVRFISTGGLSQLMSVSSASGSRAWLGEVAVRSGPEGRTEGYADGLVLRKRPSAASPVLSQSRPAGTNVWEGPHPQAEADDSGGEYWEEVI